MRQLSLMSLVLLACLLAGRPGGAAEILLTNGNVMNGEIEREDDTSLVLKVPVGGSAANPDLMRYVRITIDKEKIRRITRQGTLTRPPIRTMPGQPTGPTTPTTGGGADDPAPGPDGTLVEEPTPAPAGSTTPPMDKPANGDGMDKPAAEPGADGPTGKPGQDGDEKVVVEVDPSLKRKAVAEFTLLGDNSREVRDDARRRLVAMGEGVVPVLVERLLEKPENVLRVNLIRTLGDIGDKRTALLLIGEMDGHRKERTRMRTAHIAVRKVTGKDYPFDDGDSVARREAVMARYRAYIAEHEETFGPQFGEDIVIKHGGQ